MRSEKPVDEVPLRIENLVLDLRRRGLYRGSERIHLTPKPFEVLAYLVRNRGRAVPKDELLHAVWEGHGGQFDGNNVEQAIRHIRQALNEEKDRPRFIQTIPGQGYCFIAAVDDGQRTATIPAPSASAAGNGPRVQILLRKYWRLGGTVLASLLALAVIALRPTLPDPKLTNPVRITRSRTRILSPILTDGARLYYQQFDSGSYRVAEVAASGGETATPKMGIPNSELCDMAPDGGSLLVRELVHSREDNEPVLIQPLVGGPIRRVGEILAYDAAWFPDGQHLIYAADGSVHKSDLEGRSTQRLFAVPGNAYWFRWSPDGRRLRFTVLDPRTEMAALWEATAEGSSPHRLFPDWSDQQCCGSWTPDGNYFIFQVRVENSFQIWARREKASLVFKTNPKPVPLAFGPVDYRGPLPCKNGRKLFMRAEVPKGELVKYDRQSKQYVAVLPAIQARTAAFSRDGKWIAYTGLSDNSLWRCRSDGSECLQLTLGMQQTMLPHWAPDGRQIAFMGKRFGGKWSIFVVAANGDSPRSLSSGNHNEADPDWSPDGEQLVFGNVMEPPETTEVQILNLGNHAVSSLPGSTGYISPRWSPDGRFIVAMSAANQTLDIFEFASQKWTSLTRMRAGYPNWSHDSKHVYFLSTENGRRAVFRVSVADRKLEEAADLASVERGPFFMGDWIGLAPDDSPLAVRNMTTEDIWAWDFEGR